MSASIFPDHQNTEGCRPGLSEIAFHRANITGSEVYKFETNEEEAA
jgi:hypothetical protein